MRGQSWSSERIAQLRTLWRAGLTAEAIGQRLGGRSRSAILGKIFRLRLDADPDQPLRLKTSPADDALTPPPARRRRQRIKPADPPAPVTQHKTLLELTNVNCRWMVEASVKFAVSWAWSHIH